MHGICVIGMYLMYTMIAGTSLKVLSMLKEIEEEEARLSPNKTSSIDPVILHSTEH